MSADFAAVFPTATPPPALPFEMEARLRFFAHDVLVLRYVATDTGYACFQTGTPVRVVYGEAFNQREFVGYVNSTKFGVWNGQATLDVQCLGPSYALQEQVGKTGTNSLAVSRVSTRQTATKLACAIAGEYGLDVVRDASLEEPTTLVQGNQSKFKALVGRARERGKVFYVANTRLYFYDPVRALLVDQATAVTLTVDLKMVRDGLAVSTFRSESGDSYQGHDDAGAYVVYQVRGVDYTTAREVVGRARPAAAAIGRRGDPTFTRTLSDRSVSTTSAAQTYADGAALDARWTRRAWLTTDGSSRVQQGTAVLLRGVDSASEGVWVTAGVVHRISSEPGQPERHYRMDLELVRDGDRARGAGTPPVAGLTVRPLDTAAQRLGVRASQSVLRGRSWQSDLQREVVL